MKSFVRRYVHSLKEYEIILNSDARQQSCGKQVSCTLLRHCALGQHTSGDRWEESNSKIMGQTAANTVERRFRGLIISVYLI
jgi:hypothetical protein